MFVPKLFHTKVQLKKLIFLKTIKKAIFLIFLNFEPRSFSFSRKNSKLIKKL